MVRSWPSLACLALLAILAGCDTVFGFALPDPSIDASPTDAAGDGSDGTQVDALIDGLPDAFELGCPAGYTRINAQGSYRYSTIPRPWLDAVNDCAGDELDTVNRTHLVVLSNDLERLLLKDAHPGATPWLGLSDLVESTNFRWVTAEVSTYPSLASPPWAGGEPSNSANEFCVSLTGNGELEDGNCATSRTYFCECDAYANDSTRYEP